MGGPETKGGRPPCTPFPESAVYLRVANALAGVCTLVWLEAVSVIRGLGRPLTSCVQFGGQVDTGPQGIGQMVCALTTRLSTSVARSCSHVTILVVVR